MEAGQDKTPEPKTVKAEEKTIPAYLGVLLLILGLVAGYSIAAFTQPAAPLTPPDTPKPVVPPIITPQQPGPLNVSILYSSECDICDQTNTILTLLEQLELEYTTTLVDAATPEGDDFALKYGINSVPTAVIKKDDVLPYPQLYNAFEELFGETENAYIIPEVYMDQKVHPVMYIADMGEQCETSGEEISVLLFTDIYCSECLSVKDNIDLVRTDFNENVRFEYHYKQGGLGADLENIAGQQAIRMVPERLYCAEEQGKYTELENALATIYCDGEDEDLTLSGFELEFCGNSPRFGTWLDQIEIEKATEFAGIPGETLNACEQKRDERIEASRAKAGFFGVTGIPTAVVGCKYKMHAGNIKTALCQISPELEACAEEPENDATENP